MRDAQRLGAAIGRAIVSQWRVPIGGGNGATVPAFGISGASDGSATITGVDETATNFVIDVIDTIPAAFEDTYVVPLADLSDGVQMLHAPIIEGSGDVGELLTGTQALWVYDPAAYAAAGKVFAPTRLWHRDGFPLAGEDGFTFTLATLGTFTLVETVEKPDGTFATATSNEIAVAGAFALTSELLDSRWIDLTGTVPNTRRVAMIMLFDDMAATGRQAIVANEDTAGGVQDFEFVVYTEGFGSVFKISTPDAAFGVTPNIGSPLAVAPRTVAVYAMANIDKFDGSNIAHHGMISSATALNNNTRNNAVTTSTAPITLADGWYFNRGRNTFPTDNLLTGTKLRFLWIATDFPGDTATNSITLRDEFLGQFFEVTGTAPNVVIAVKPLAADGAITIDGETVTPDLFLAGQNFGQYDDAGTKRLTNRGTGADPILNGDFFA